MTLIGNIIWFIFGGLIEAIGWQDCSGQLQLLEYQLVNSVLRWQKCSLHPSVKK